MKNIKTVIWDWNGTLFDDLKICIATENEMLKARNLPLIDSLERYFSVFTFPVKKFYENLGLDFTKESYEDVAAEYVTGYESRLPECGLMSGAQEVLEEIKRAGMNQVIISAASQISLQKQIAPFGIDGYFSEILGIYDDLAEGKIGLAKEFFKRSGTNPDEAIFIGDTVHDYEVAQAVGCRCLLIAAGHHSRDTLEKTGAPVLESITNVISFLSELAHIE